MLLHLINFFLKETLSGAHSLEVPYLFQTDKTLYDPVLDIGKKVVQCGRKVTFTLITKSLKLVDANVWFPFKITKNNYFMRLIKLRCFLSSLQNLLI